MTTYLIEVPHSGDTVECQYVIKTFVESGSHLLSHAYWGCKAGVHKSWFIGEFGNKEEALQIIPPFLRRNASFIELVKFDKNDLQQFAQANRHQGAVE